MKNEDELIPGETGLTGRQPVWAVASDLIGKSPIGHAPIVTTYQTQAF